MLNKCLWLRLVLTADKKNTPAGEVAGVFLGGKGYKMWNYFGQRPSCRYYSTTRVVVVKPSVSAGIGNGDDAR